MRANTSASNIFRRQLCPGSATAEMGQPRSEDSKDSALGTRLHALDAADADSEILTEAEFLQRNRMIRDEFMAHQRREHKIPDDEHCLTFKDNLEFWLKDEHGQKLKANGADDFSGHPDVVYYFPARKLLFLMDTKTGRKPVASAEMNLQLRAYGVMISGDSGEFDADITTVAITQPHCRPSLTACAYSRDDLKVAKAELLDIWRNSLMPDAPRYRGYAQCEHCLAAASCQQGIALAKELATLKVSEIPISQMEGMAELMELLGLVYKRYWERMEWIAANHPTLLANHELKPGATIESVAPENAEAAWALLKVNGAMDDRAAFDDCRKLSVAKLREIVGKTKGLGKEKAKALVSEILKPVIELSQNKPSLVEKKRVLMLEAKV